MPRSLPRMPGRRTADHGLVLPARTATRLREDLPSVAEQVVAAIIEEVPAYETAMAGSMGDTIRNAVQLALGGFLSLAGGRRGADPRTPPPTGIGDFKVERHHVRRSPAHAQFILDRFVYFTEKMQRHMEIFGPNRASVPNVQARGGRGERLDGERALAWGTEHGRDNRGWGAGRHRHGGGETVEFF